ncbi:hypothetical protein GCM10009122_36310 [Fulvivirga kasyanovii]|uniref:Alpha/beta hydrolase n=1 Tax=Fulvivirga kasyanovii TaxID=396812 RepID=A0ABW9RYU0_9BACT|nr:alpha/beta hydrolase [Fulvivirga kasyanovii]MTI29121.1 alpha/beta hydrolase [Fulvivirga kasyanovii]
MTIYGIPGLGADERVFQYLQMDIVPIQWLAPLRRERLSDYVLRLIAQIDQTQPFVLLGVSFGGMVAVEMNKFIKPEKTIIISSAATHKELPQLARVVGKTGIIDLLPTWTLKPPSFLANYFFGIDTAEGKALLRSILKSTDIHFMKWAIKQIAHWQNENIPAKLVRIHGERDRLLKMHIGINYEEIWDGGHLMIVEKAHEVSLCIQKQMSVT